MKTIIPFLLRAKKATYAGHGNETEATRPASHDLVYGERKRKESENAHKDSIEKLLYYDTYLGGERFCGEEAVWIDGKPIWSMNYAGRVIGSGFSGDFLKAALSQATEESPYRGPQEYSEGEFLYRCEVTGVFEWFQGYEEIFRQGEKIYECYFHGGAVE